jgi:Flp pilus assembly protein TadD
MAAVLAACVSSQPPVRGASYADFLIGRLANAREDHDVAADRYFSALRRAPGDSALLSGALISALDSGDVERAREAARMAPHADASGYAHLVLAADSMAAGYWRRAEEQLQRVEGGAAEELAGRMMSVWAQTAQGRVADVVMDLSPLASIRPYGGLFAYQQAMALDYAGRHDEALAAYSRGAQGGLWLPSGIEHHADLLWRRSARNEAVALLSNESSRSSPELAAALARTEAGSGPASAPLDPARGAAAGLRGLAAIFLQEADAQNGLAAMTLAMILDPRSDGARLAFAQAQSDRGHADVARAMLAQIPADSIYAGSARRLESWILLDSGEEEQAFALARENAESGESRAMRSLADMYRSRGRFQEAEPLYSELVTRSPEDWRLRFARGVARERLGRWPEAEADLQHALALSPDQPDVMNYLGYSWVDRGERLPDALALIQRAVELRPLSGAIIDSLGWAYFRMGDYVQALDYIERAVELEPADPTLNDHLGDVYWRLGRRIEARFQWRRALTLTPDDPAAIEAKLTNGMPDAPQRQSVQR